jgi:hypothetical protein
MDVKDRPIVFFGPPGVGKSTLVKAAGDLGYDLESTWPAPPDLDALMAFRRVGAAGHPPDAFPADRFIRVLLLPPRSVYDPRREARDAVQPEKANQDDVYDDFASDTSSFDLVLDDF